MIRIVIIEDSSTIRYILRGIFSSDPEIMVIGEADNGDDGISMVKNLKPDLITMDIRMPKKNGFESTLEIMRICPTPILVISSSVESSDLNIAFNAIKAGALDIVEKPKGNLTADFSEVGKKIIQKIKILVDVKVIRRHSNKRDMENEIVKKETKVDQGNNFIFDRDFSPQIIAIISSTGGPAALLNIFKELDKDFPIPICVVQHITPGFGQGLVDWIRQECDIRVKFAEDNEKIEGGCVYFAQDDQHMIITKGKRIKLNKDPAVVGLRPYGNYFLNSVASTYQENSIGIILTGMGQDGVTGIKRMKDMGAITIGQDETSSIIYGMPREAYEAGGITIQLPIRKIGSQLKELILR